MGFTGPSKTMTTPCEGVKKLARPQVTVEIRLYCPLRSLVRRDISDRKLRGWHFRSPKNLDFLNSIFSHLLTIAARKRSTDGQDYGAATVSERWSSEGPKLGRPTNVC